MTINLSLVTSHPEQMRDSDQDVVVVLGPIVWLMAATFVLVPFCIEEFDSPCPYRSLLQPSRLESL